MIRSFKSREAEKIFNREISVKLPFSIQRTALRKLCMIDSAKTINDLRIPPANRLEKLKGQRFDKYSLRINDQWRICFKWNHGDVCDLEIIDYHF